MASDNVSKKRNIIHLNIYIYIYNYINIEIYKYINICFSKTSLLIVFIRCSNLCSLKNLGNIIVFFSFWLNTKTTVVFSSFLRSEK